MEAKTYTKRENARRAGVAAGVPAELQLSALQAMLKFPS